MLTVPQPSLAVAAPVTFVVVTAGHSNTRSIGMVRLGGVISRTVTWLQVSVAVAAPVLLVLVSAGQSRTTSAGRVSTGLVLSRTVMVWTQLRLLPHSSVAVHARAITLAPAQLLLTESLKLIVT